jgi:hypothetical protein
MNRYVIFSHNETIANVDGSFEPLFWNDNDGWVSLATATVFEQHDFETFPYLPIGGRWVQLPEFMNSSSVVL